MTDLQIINLLQEAVELSCDGGPSSFTLEEYEEMYNFLNKLRNNIN